MKNNIYSKEIANAINNFLVNDDWNFSFDEEKGIFRFGVSLDSKIKKINYSVKVNAHGFTVYVISPIGVEEHDRDMMLNMAEFICRANYVLRSGNFELDMEDGEIRYKIYTDCDGGIIPTYEMVKNSIHCPAIMFDQYAPGIIDIIFGNVSAMDAIKRCEKSMEEELHSLYVKDFCPFITYIRIFFGIPPIKIKIFLCLAKLLCLL